MAESGAKWPGPVTFDDEPKRGFARLTLSIPKLTVKSAFMGKAKPKNAVIMEDFSKQSVRVTITVDGGETYEYNKSLPEDIDPDESTHEVKAGQVMLHLCKVEPGSWADHAKYLIKKE